MAKLIKKISTKNVCGKPEREVIGKDGDKDVIGFKEKVLMTVIGVCTGTRTGNTQYGDFMGLRGQFQATNQETGEVFRSSQCFLADDVTDMVAAQLSMDGVNSVEFAFEVGIRPSETSIGYEYTARPLIEAQENDPIQALMLKIEKPKEDGATVTNIKQDDKPATKKKAGAK